MNKDSHIKYKSMIHSKTYTEEELYVDDIESPENDMKCNICEKGISKVNNLMRRNTNVDKKKKKTRKKTRMLKEPLQCEYCHKTFTTKLNLKRHNLTHM